MNNKFMPLKLLIRTLSIMCGFMYLLFDIFSKKKYPKIFIVSFIIFMHVIIPQTLLITARVAASNNDLAHDGGVIQMEESMKFLLDGKNPYHEDFTATPLNNWRGFKSNIVYHVPYMPGAFLYSLPVYVVWKGLFDWYDQRIIYLFLLILSILFIAGSVKDFEKKMVAVIFFSLNPFIIKYFMLGTNDIIIFFFLFGAVFFFQRQKKGTGFFMLALACSCKQFSWFFVPFLTMYALDFKTLHPAHLIEKFNSNRKILLPGLICFLATVFPFIIWNSPSFFKDTFLYASGGLPTSYPMQGFHGFGFATLLLFLRFVPDGMAYFPFFSLQIIVLIPLLYFLIRKQLSNNTLENSLLFSALTLGVFMFFSRYLNGNFVGFIIFWPFYVWALSTNGNFVQETT